MKSNLVHVHLTTQFNGVEPGPLYKIYVNGEEHVRATGRPAAIDARVSAYRGHLTGRFILFVPGELMASRTLRGSCDQIFEGARSREKAGSRQSAGLSGSRCMPR